MDGGGLLLPCGFRQELVTTKYYNVQYRAGPGSSKIFTGNSSRVHPIPEERGPRGGGAIARKVFVLTTEELRQHAVPLGVK